MKQYIIFIFLYLVFIRFNKAYFKLYPSIPVYPNSYLEADKVKILMKYRTKKDVDFFHLTNQSVTQAFLPYVNETKKQIDNIVFSQTKIIRFFKYSINRIRPYQIDNTIIPINISTAQTPSYPAGHAYQAYLVAKVLSKKYPEKKELLHKIALQCDMCRVRAGLHYPSDGVFSRKLVDYFNM